MLPKMNLPTDMYMDRGDIIIDRFDQRFTNFYLHYSTFNIQNLNSECGMWNNEYGSGARPNNLKTLSILKLSHYYKLTGLCVGLSIDPETYLVQIQSPGQ